MDILELIQKKINQLPKNIDAQSFQSILSHIQIAEEHFLRGTSEDLEYLFNDVLYRLNQAYEGGIREAYRVIKKDDKWSSVKAYQIEEFFEKNQIFNARVTKLFKNYREDWRNQSTHNYNLKIVEEEAFLAISSVSAFVSILIDAIIYTASQDSELSQGKKSAHKSALKSEGNEASLTITVEKILRSFSIHLSESKYKDEKGKFILTEAQVQGMLVGYVKNLDLGLQILTEFKVQVKDKFFRPDLLIKRGSENLIVELKRASTLPLPSSTVFQVLSYMSAVGTSEAIVFVADPGVGSKWATDVLEFSHDKSQQVIKVMYSK